MYFLLFQLWDSRKKGVEYSMYFLLFQLWDSRKKGVLQTFQNTYQVTAVSLSDTAEQVISGGIDNDIKVR